MNSNCTDSKCRWHKIDKPGNHPAIVAKIAKGLFWNIIRSNYSHRELEQLQRTANNG